MLTTTNAHTSMVCARCGHTVYKSDNPEYSYQCFNCDEDLYKHEVQIKTEESQKCVYCNTEISWNSPDVQKSEIYGCETCGKAFCGTCFKEITQQDNLPGFWDSFECPDCWKLNDNKINF